jgi:hypothetical protein
MESEVRRLLIEHGVKKVKECVDKVCRNLYEELREVYGETVVAVETPEPAPVVEAPPVEKERRLRIVKKKEPVEPPVETPVEAAAGAAEAPGDKVVEVVTMRVKKKVAAPVEVQQAAEESDSDSDATVPVDLENECENTQNDQSKSSKYPKKTPEEIRKDRDAHLAAVEAKRVELVNRGISPKTLLTRENLEKWLKSGMSYQRIARDHVGLSEKYIAGFAKNYGLKSNIADVIRLRRARGLM